MGLEESLTLASSLGRSENFAGAAAISGKSAGTGAGTGAMTGKVSGSFADYYTRSLQEKAQAEKIVVKSKTDSEKAAEVAAEHAALAGELSDYLKKSPAQHLRDAVMKEMGITEEELAAMPPAQRQAKEKEITERIRERLDAVEKNRGSKPDALAQGVLVDTKRTTPALEANQPVNLGSSGFALLMSNSPALFQG